MIEGEATRMSGLAVPKARVPRHAYRAPRGSRRDPMPHSGCVCECVHARVDSHVSACVYMWEPCVRVREFMRVHGMRVCAYVSTHLC